jgi:uncharacterized protein (DUF305 family)
MFNINNRLVLASTALVLLIAGAIAVAASHSGSHGHDGYHEHMDNPAVQAHLQANERMHSGMAIEFSGNADIDFARGMIPHHEGAIDMANVVLEHGSDPAIRELAEEIIAAQEAEIAFLREWLGQHAD